MKSGQVSTEFIFSLIMIFLILIMLLAVNFDKRIQLNNLKSFVSARQECLTISNGLNSIYINGPDSRTSFNIYNLATIYNNSRIEINDVASGKLLTQCFYTAPFMDTLYNLTGQINFNVNPTGVIMLG